MSDQPTRLDELAQEQGVKPVENVHTLFGTWPGDVNDGFEEAIDELRHGGTAWTGKT